MKYFLGLEHSGKLMVVVVLFGVFMGFITAPSVAQNQSIVKVDIEAPMYVCTYTNPKDIKGKIELNTLPDGTYILSDIATLQFSLITPDINIPIGGCSNENKTIKGVKLTLPVEVPFQFEYNPNTGYSKVKIGPVKLNCAFDYGTGYIKDIE